MGAAGALALAVLGQAGLLAVWALVAAVTRRPRGVAHAAGLVVLELALLAQAAVRSVGLATGDVPVAPSTHAGYLVASVAVLPLLLALTRPGGQAGRGEQAWFSAVTALACVTVLVVEVRLLATGPPR